MEKTGMILNLLFWGVVVGVVCLGMAELPAVHVSSLGELTVPVGTDLVHLQRTSLPEDDQDRKAQLLNLPFLLRTGGTLLPAGNTSALVVSGALVNGAVDYPVLDLGVTWNNFATAFTGIKLVVTNTASGSGSRLVDLRTQSGSKWSVNSLGNVFQSGILNINSGAVTMGSDGSANFASGALAVAANGAVNPLTLASLVADPVAPVAGQVWFRSDTRVLKFYDGVGVRTVTAT